MSTFSVFQPNTLRQGSALQVGRGKPQLASTLTRSVFWILGFGLAVAQAWVFRYRASADSISYLDMSDGVLPGGNWHRLITGVWSPLYPFLLGLTRLTFRISARHEVAAGHVLNLGFFAFAFVCFEYFLRIAIRGIENRNDSLAKPAVLVPLPRWAYASLAYSLFLWASISAISTRELRPDMLMSGFLYLAVGLLLRMREHPPRWCEFLALGVVLGMGFLAKAPMLPLGVLILALSLAVVENWRAAMKMTVTALALMLLIGSLYFVPLSLARKRLTMGESASFNFLVHVDRMGPTWYLQVPGWSRGTLLHPPERIFLAPPAYAFAVPQSVTHPLRFDPSIWTVGVRPHLALRPYLWVLREGIFVFLRLLRQLLGFAALVLVLAWVLHRNKKLAESLRSNWPVWLIGLAGCAMYALVHVEPRYAGAFVVLLGLGFCLGVQVPEKFNSKIALLTIVVAAALLLPVGWHIYVRHSQGVGKLDDDGLAAAELSKFGIQAGDRVARISPITYDLGIERIARVEVVAEVAFDHVGEFWAAPEPVQERLLGIFASRGAKAVIATQPMLNEGNAAQWRQLGATQFWVWLPKPKLSLK